MTQASTVLFPLAFLLPSTPSGSPQNKNHFCYQLRFLSTSSLENRGTLFASDLPCKG